MPWVFGNVAMSAGQQLWSDLGIWTVVVPGTAIIVGILHIALGVWDCRTAMVSVTAMVGASTVMPWVSGTTAVSGTASVWASAVPCVSGTVMVKLIWVKIAFHVWDSSSKNSGLGRHEALFYNSTIQ